MGSLTDGPHGRSNPSRVTILALLQIGSTNAVALGVGLAAGWFVDSRLGTTPVFIFVGMALGIVIGVLATYRLISQYLRQ